MSTFAFFVNLALTSAVVACMGYALSSTPPLRRLSRRLFRSAAHARRALARVLRRRYDALRRRPDYARIAALELELGLRAPSAGERQLQAVATALTDAVRSMGISARDIATATLPERAATSETPDAADDEHDTLSATLARVQTQLDALDTKLTRIKRAEQHIKVVVDGQQMWATASDIALATRLATHTGLTLDKALTGIALYRRQCGDVETLTYAVDALFARQRNTRAPLLYAHAEALRAFWSVLRLYHVVDA